MKKQLFFLALAMVGFRAIAQTTDPRDAEIRRLENIEREAAMSGDSVVLFGKIWSNDMVVNAPANRVCTVGGSKMQLRTGNL